MKKRLSIVAVLIAICTLFSVFVGCFQAPQDKEFSKAGMTITLTNEFTEQEIVTQTAYYVSAKAIVTVLKEEGSVVGNYSVGEYARLVCSFNNLDSSSVVVKETYAEFTYEKELSGKEYYYYARCLKNGSDYWLIQFACETKNAEAYQANFETWANSVTFAV